VVEVILDGHGGSGEVLVGQPLEKVTVAPGVPDLEGHQP
jgi:hypothetical protein